MTYFLEYVTRRGVGRARIECGTLDEALAKAEQSMKRLSCFRARSLSQMCSRIYYEFSVA